MILRGLIFSKLKSEIIIRTYVLYTYKGTSQYSFRNDVFSLKFAVIVKESRSFS